MSCYKRMRFFILVKKSNDLYQSKLIDFLRVDDSFGTG